jgi:pyruvate carboxylase
MEENNSAFEKFHLDDTDYETRLTKAFRNRKFYTVPDDRKIFSMIPGTIVEIVVKAGKKVKKGDLVMLLDAMKMKNRVAAPFDGVISKIHVTVGTTVAKNILLFEMK